MNRNDCFDEQHSTFKLVAIKYQLVESEKYKRAFAKTLLSTSTFSNFNNTFNNKYTIFKRLLLELMKSEKQKLLFLVLFLKNNLLIFSSLLWIKHKTSTKSKSVYEWNRLKNISFVWLVYSIDNDFTGSAHFFMITLFSSCPHFFKRLIT